MIIVSKLFAKWLSCLQPFVVYPCSYFFFSGCWYIEGRNTFWYPGHKLGTSCQTKGPKHFQQDSLVVLPFTVNSCVCHHYFLLFISLLLFLCLIRWYLLLFVISFSRMILLAVKLFILIILAITLTVTVSPFHLTHRPAVQVHQNSQVQNGHRKPQSRAGVRSRWTRSPCRVVLRRPEANARLQGVSVREREGGRERVGGLLVGAYWLAGCMMQWFSRGQMALFYPDVLWNYSF